MPFSNGAFRLLACSAILLSLLELHAALALGQGSPTPSRTANLTTIVFDASGAVIPNAEVTFKGEKTVTTKTGQDGSIELPLPYGSYAVTISCPGFKTNKIIGFSLDTAKPPVLNIVLQIKPTECNPCLPLYGTAQTIISDLPNVIEPSVPLQLELGGGPMTLFPPSVYMQSFRACSADKPCTRSETFRVDSMPRGCCVLSLTNGDGHGTDEVRSYLVFLNGKRVLPAGHAQRSASAVKVHQDNILKVILTGEPYSKVFIQIAYDPSQSK